MEFLLLELLVSQVFVLTIVKIEVFLNGTRACHIIIKSLLLLSCYTRNFLMTIEFSLVLILSFCSGLMKLYCSSKTGAKHILLVRRSPQTSNIWLLFVAWLLHPLWNDFNGPRVTWLQTILHTISWSLGCNVCVVLSLFSKHLWRLNLVQTKLITNSIWLLCWWFSQALFGWLVQDLVLFNLKAILSLLDIIMLEL